MYANKSVDLSPYSGQWNVRIAQELELLHPVARYILIATDADEYITKVRSKANDFEFSDIENYTSTVTYNGFFAPSAVNTLNGKLSKVETAITFDAEVDIKEQTNEVVVAMDYPFAALGAVDNVDITVKIYDEKGVLVNQNGGVKFDIERGKLSVYRGELFTLSIKPPSITIVTEYDGVINVEISDEGDVNIETED